MPSGSGPTSPTTPSSAGLLPGSERKASDTNIDISGSCSGNEPPPLTQQISNDSTSLVYVQRTRVTRTAPPKPACNPLQFVQIRPCNLYQSAQEQLKRAEEVKKVKQVKKEEPEDWQSNLDNWKSCRRKRVEHIIDRVVEVKKLEMEEQDKMRRKSKTFSEMLEERESKGRKPSLAVYAIEDDTNDLSDLGIGTSSVSGKSSLSEDFDNHSVISDNQDGEKGHFDIDNHSNLENSNRDYVSSPGYDTSSSTAPASSPDPCEYTYEGAIQEYKIRVSRSHLSDFNSLTGYPKDNVTTVCSNSSSSNSSSSSSSSGGSSGNVATNTINNNTTIANNNTSKPERSISMEIVGGTNVQNSKRLLIPKMIEERLNAFEPKTYSNSNELNAETIQMPQQQLQEIESFDGTVNVLKRRKLFEKEKAAIDDFQKVINRVSEDLAASLSIKERLMNLEKHCDDGGSSGLTKESHTKTVQLSDNLNSNVKNILTKIQYPSNDNKITNDLLENIDVASDLNDTCENNQITLNQNCNMHFDDDDDASPITNIITTTTTTTTDNSSQFIDTTITNESVQCDTNQIKITANSLLECNDIVENNTNICTTNNADDSGIQTADVSVLSLANESITNNGDQQSNEQICNNVNESINTIAGEQVADNFDCIADIIMPTNIEQLSNNNVVVDELQLKQIDDTHVLNANLDVTTATSNQNTSVNEALEEAFKEIDSETMTPTIGKNTMPKSEPIYENIIDICELYEELDNELNACTTNNCLEQCSVEPQIKQIDEPFYQVPKPIEPYYEVPKPKPVPLYENIEILYSSKNNNNNNNNVYLKYPYKNDEHHSSGGPPLVQLINRLSTLTEPPKEKPPPPPIDDGHSSDDTTMDVIKNTNEQQHQLNGNGNENGDYKLIEKTTEINPFKRINSTKRIKKELHNKRSSFLGIENTDDNEHCLEFTVAPPPDLAALIQEERRLEKQLYIKAGLYDSSDTTDSRDSGVSENHSRQSSDPMWEEQDDFYQQTDNDDSAMNEINKKIAPEMSWNYNSCLEAQIREQEEVLRVERELLQLEQEELKRQKENLLLRENVAREELLDHGAKMLMSSNRYSLQDINNVSALSSPLKASPNSYVYTSNNQSFPNIRQSMPNLQDVLLLNDLNIGKTLPPIPPNKPQRAYQQTLLINGKLTDTSTNFSHSHDFFIRQSHLQSMTNENKKSQNQTTVESNGRIRQQQQHQFPASNTSRHAIQALSAAPKSKLQEHWVQQNGKTNNTNLLASSSSWVYQKPKSNPLDNKNWPIHNGNQQRDVRQLITPAMNPNSNRSVQQQSRKNDGPLPDAIIQTLTQRVQNCGLGERKISDIITSKNDSLPSASTVLPLSNGKTIEQSHKEILSVSGKKKCSYCHEELGRGAAMIIESLQLFYHLDCFKCCVCQTQLGDGISGADVRVRSQKLHCQNCFSSDDGIKFSCV